MGNILVAYYSRAGENYVSGKIVSLPVGNTEIVAGIIRDALGADTFKIEQAEEYSSEYKKCCQQAKADLEKNARPALATLPGDISKYDALILAYPNYCGTAPMAVFTFLDNVKLAGKPVLPLCTNEGSGMGRSEADIKRNYPAVTLRSGLSIKGSDAQNALPLIQKWLKSENVIGA